MRQVSSQPNLTNNAFNVSFHYSSKEGPTVHAYPNVGLRNDLPTQLQGLGGLAVQAAWSMAPATERYASETSTKALEPSALAANNVQADVCIDMFADMDEKKSMIPTEQKYEIMIWFANFGYAAHPTGDSNIGIQETIEDTKLQVPCTRAVLPILTNC